MDEIMYISAEGWPGDAGDSQTLVGVVTKLDWECSRRCEEWDMTRANLPLSLLWTRFSFRFLKNISIFSLSLFVFHFQTRK